MSTNVPRPPRPPRPGGATQPPSAPTSAPPPSKPTGGSDFGDTRTVILSRKSMGMMQSLKDEEAAKASARVTSGPAAAAPAPVAPQLPRASVVDGIVSCIKCSASFPIVSDEYYGAQVECPDCAAEFVIPTQAELAAQAKPQAPMPSRPAPAPAAPAPAARQAPAAPAPAAAAPEKPKKKKATVKVPDFMQNELNGSEEVYFCKHDAGSNGSVAGIAGGAIAMIGGVVAPLVATGPVAAGIAAGVGVVGIIIGVVLGKKAGGPRALVVTDSRVIAKNGDWVAESDLDQ